MKNINQYRPKLAELTLKDPVQSLEIQGATIKMASFYSKKFQDARDAMLDAVESGNSETPKTKREWQLHNNRLLATLFVSWNEEFFIDPCTEEAVLKLLDDPEMSWMADQVNSFVMSSKNFFLI